MEPQFDIRYDRRVSDDFVRNFVDDGFASSLVSMAKGALYPVDLRLRADAKSGREHATLYTGLTAVLQVHRARGGSLRMSAAPAHQKTAQFDAAWSVARPPEEWRDLWPEVELYLERIIPDATTRFGQVEGAVQAAIANHRQRARIILDREVTPSFRDAAFKKSVLEECQAPILRALASRKLNFSGMPKRLGNECDALAIDESGRVLAIEVKPLRGAGIPWVAAQATMYARLLQTWIDRDEQSPREVLLGMAEQRHRLRLAPPFTGKLAERPRVTPVVALQRGASSELIRRMLEVRDVLAAEDLGVEPLQLYEVSLVGEMIPLDESRTPSGRSRRGVLSFAQRANATAERWKADTDQLPPEAKQPGRVRAGGREFWVGYALPEEYASLNLLHEVRGPVTEQFARRGIPWHMGVNGGPSNHLRSSQVQCANALGRMITEPDLIKRAFGRVLDIGTVKDFGEIEKGEQGSHLVFEFVGETDYFGEARGGRLTPGANCTSVDAAFAYRTSDGVDELALVEWKFSEAYPSRDNKAAAKLATRLKRYGPTLSDPDGPVRLEDVEPADIFHEPIYQLARQQLLAHRLECDAAVDADVVRVVHVLSPDNLEYEASFVTPTLRRRAGMGAGVGAVWQSLLRRPDRFVKLDPAVFADPAITSEEYCRRYAST